MPEITPNIEELKEKLGRKVSIDERDLLYPLQALVVKKSGISQRYWDSNGWWGNQGNTPQCVGYAWAHWLEDGPVPQPGTAPILHPTYIYNEAQKIDEWAGENYDGTSVRAGAKVLYAHGFIKEYRWGFTLQSLIDSILNVGPVVVGTNWYYNMYFPDSAGVIRYGGQLLGGHAYVVNGVNTDTKMFRIKNSWGKSWGISGHAFISFEDMGKLMLERGEICYAVEIEKTTTTSSSTTTTTTRKPITKVVKKKAEEVAKVLSEQAQKAIEAAKKIRDSLLKK